MILPVFSFCNLSDEMIYVVGNIFCFYCYKDRKKYKSV